MNKYDSQSIVNLEENSNLFLKFLSVEKYSNPSSERSVSSTR